MKKEENISYRGQFNFLSLFFKQLFYNFFENDKFQKVSNSMFHT